VIIALYRGDVFYRSEEIPNPTEESGYGMRPDWNIRHMRPLMPIDFDAPLNPMEMTDAIERFEFDAKSGQYVSVNFNSLPRWVIQQEMADAEAADRRARFDRVTRMMMERR
jgi:hypothetical protein